MNTAEVLLNNMARLQMPEGKKRRHAKVSKGLAQLLFVRERIVDSIEDQPGYWLKLPRDHNGQHTFFLNDETTLRLSPRLTSFAVAPADTRGLILSRSVFVSIEIPPTVRACTEFHIGPEPPNREYLSPQDLVNHAPDIDVQNFTNLARQVYTFAKHMF